MNHSLSFATQHMTCYMMPRYMREHTEECVIWAHK